MQRKIFGGKIKLADIILVLSLLTLAFSVFIIVEITRDTGETVAVIIDGRESGLYSLGDDGEYPLNGGTNILVIKNGEAYIGRADCPKQTCVNWPFKISRVGQSIVCAENGVRIEVRGSGDGILEV